MSITVKIFTKAGGRPSLYAAREFDALPVSIGRDPACSMVLEDPHKHISRFHVELEEQDGVYWMTVVSKVNPVMVKGRRYGPATRLTLRSGDSFEIGEYEIHVALPELPAPEPGIFDEPTFVGGGAPAEPTLVPAARARASAAPAAADRALLEAFLEGAGVPHKDLSPQQAERLMRDSGAILRAAIEGLMMLLIARGEMRKEFRAEERTMVAARDNNPLKLMSDPHEAMAFIFDPSDRTDGFLDPVQAIGDACEDLRSHEIALMAGMRAAILGALRRCDPRLLERAQEKAGGLGFFGRKGRLWERFLAEHEKLLQEAQDDFQKVFGRDFMGAYQAQLRRLKGGR
ncbi:MAG TPA: type VI secretion system-associated FHA domain protein TagH [Burkholderiales bacterium]